MSISELINELRRLRATSGNDELPVYLHTREGLLELAELVGDEACVLLCSYSSKPTMQSRVQSYVETWRQRANEQIPAESNERKRYDVARAEQAERSLAKRSHYVISLAELQRVLTHVVRAVTP